MKIPDSNHFSNFLAIAIGAGATCVVVFLVYFIVNPSYSYTAQQPVFFTTWDFFLETARYPGGLAAYLGLFASQWYYYPWLGATISALLMGAVYAGALLFLRLLTGAFLPMVALLLFALLFIMHCSFFHVPEFDFQILLLCICGIASLPYSRMKGVSGLPALLAILLVAYAFAGIAVAIAYLIMLLGIKLHDGAGVRELPAPLILVVMGIAATGAARLMSIIPDPFKDVASAINSPHYAISFLPGIVLLYFSSAPLWLSLIKKHLLAKRFFRGRLPLIGGYVAIIGLGFAASSFSIDPAIQRCIRFDHLATQREWKSILDEEQSLTVGTTNDIFFLYRSLYHENMLGSAVGLSNAMIFDAEKSPFLFSMIFNSDLFFEMGATNQAIRWAFEAINNYGCRSPRLLQRLTLCYAAQGKTEMARSLLGILDNTIVGRQWARRFAPVLKDSLRLAANDEIRRLRMLEPVKAYISLPHVPSYEFRHIWFHSRTFNRMAFEYSLLLIPELMSEHRRFSGFAAECQAGNAGSCMEIEHGFANTRMMYDYMNARSLHAQRR